ncbi:MAG TPA: divalent-cation tolerance protein CutA [Longimicrobiales bacterium]|nr:divalent-cation tolerance protein CutA [Longimicrobiales bacterium]
MREQGPISVVLVTAPSAEVAAALVTTVVEERLAACGNIVPGVVSIYRWQDAVQQDDEVLIVLKTAPAVTDRLMDRVRVLHPYDVPEIVVLPVSDVLPAYAQWVLDSGPAPSGR